VENTPDGFFPSGNFFKGYENCGSESENERVPGRGREVGGRSGKCAGLCHVFGGVAVLRRTRDAWGGHADLLQGAAAEYASAGLLKVMFARHTVLLLRAGPAGNLTLPIPGRARACHFARNVMEAKQHLLRCLKNMNPRMRAAPDFILVDAGDNNADIKAELEHWMGKHPRLHSVKVIFPRRSWLRRWWELLGLPGWRTAQGC
jgi:hypothetical protein